MTALPITLGKLIPQLGTNHDGEVVATVAAIGRVLASAGLDWHDLAAALSPDGIVADDWHDTVAYCALHLDRLSQKEREFVSNISRRTSKPTEKQLIWLNDIALKLRGQQS